MSASASFHVREQFSAPIAQTTPLPARIGRLDAELLGATNDEARLRHCGSLKVGAEVLLSFVCGGTTIQTAALVRSCRVAALGGGKAGATLYESSLELSRLTADEREALKVIAGGCE